MKNIKDLTLKEKLGQLLFCGFEDAFYDDHVRELVEEYKVGNIILFSRNVVDMKQLVKLDKDLYNEIIKNTGIIPFISIDQEGGMVTRIMNGGTFCPGSMTIAATQDKNNAYKIGKIMGEELLKLGINFNLAPSLDVNNNPDNPVIGVRSYSDDPKMVAEFGNEYIRGLQEEGVIATAKHFPGHGDTNVDSHLGLPSLDFDTERLNNVELVPFRSAINKGVKAIMSAHIIFKKFDNVPATLSHKFLTELLRDEMGFEGLLVSDGMQMKAIDNLYTTEKGVVMAVNAGINIACVCHSLDRQVGAIKALEEAVKDGTLPMEVLDERVERILKAKEEIEKSMYDNFINKTEDEIVSYFDTIKPHKEEAQRITDASLTLVKGNAFKKTGKTLVIGNVPFASTIAEDKLNSRNALEMVKEYCDNVDTYIIDVDPTNIDEVLASTKGYDKVILITFNANKNKGQAELAKKLQELYQDNFYVISSRNPYDTLCLEKVNNIVSLYEYTPLSINTIVKYINGNVNPTGSLPVNVLKRLPIGASIYLGLDEYKLEDNIKYLELLKKKNVNYVFISAQMEERNENFDTEFKTIINYAKENNFKIILDVNKNRLKELEESGLTDGVYAMRLDYGFSREDMLAMQDKPYYIELNASTISTSLLDYLKENKADFSRFRLSHNFFPKPYTGMSFDVIRQKNDEFHKYGFTVMAYMPTFEMKRPPMYRGLPTIEECRDSNIIANVSELIMAHCDTIFFGDAYASEKELDEAVNNNTEVVQIPIVVKKGISKEMMNQLLKLHHNREDNSEYMIRSSIRGVGIEKFNAVKRNPKDVTIDNVNYKRYVGEIGIALKEMEQDDGVNVVGRCLCNMNLLNNITGSTKFKFVIVGEE